MEAEVYLDRTLAKYAPSYDLTVPFTGGGVSFEAYGHYLTQDEKYVLTRRANLWRVRGHEHIVFRIVDDFADEDIRNAEQWIEAYMEPELVRGGARYPEKDHMVSYLTFVFISRCTPDEAALKTVQGFRLEKDYLFTLRGHSKARMVCVDTEREAVFTNKAGRALKQSFLSTFAEVHKGLKGYHRLYCEQTE